MQLNFTTVTWPILAIWGLALLAVGVGFLIGYIDSNIRSAKKIETAESKANVIRAESEKRLADAEALKAQIPAASDDPGLLRLKNRNGAPSLEMDGTPLNIKNVSADQKKRLIELLSIIRPWLEGTQSALADLKPIISTPQTAPRPVTAQPGFSATSPTPTKPLPVTSLTDREFKALSMIAQIDYVFQNRIIGTPYEGMGIRITEGAVGSVEVRIGPNKYESIDNVPDAEIIKNIRAAISEWEQKYIPGV